MFFTTIFIASVIFFRLAKKWPTIMVNWDSVEKSLPPFTLKKDKEKMAFNIKFVICVLGTLSLGMFLSSKFYILSAFFV